MKTIQTKSPINKANIIGQNTKLLNALIKRKSLHMVQMVQMGIGTPHSRIAEVRLSLMEKGITLHDEFIRVPNLIGLEIQCKRYWIDEKDKKKLKNIR